jgi:hypothetical protein
VHVVQTRQLCGPASAFIGLNKVVGFSGDGNLAVDAGGMGECDLTLGCNTLLVAWGMRV